ncbi:MAG: CAAX prenyl protease-related protein [Verrucomicrobia bacterium]|nr:CAAX prenyl protease-related protein [Verrucomicrobiota bacterium]
MILLRKQFAGSPLLARVAPFVIFVLLTFCQGLFGEASRYWFYLAKTLVGIWLIWEMRAFVTEMRWTFSWEAVVVGVGVCALWVGLEELYPKLGKAGAAWNPFVQFAEGSALAWTFVVVRLLGSSLVVPPLEEVFYRSFLYRYLAKTDFLSVPLGQFAWLPFLATSAVFGFAHREWLAGILCAMAYQWLVIRKQRLGDAMTAHAITNLLLGLWVVGRNDWKFW